MAFGVLLLGLVVCVVASPANSQSNAPRYRVVHDWPQLPFNDMLNEVSAVAVDSHEHVFVLTRGGRKWPDDGPMETAAIDKSTVLVFDGASGRLVSTWPNGILAMPHSITIDDHDDVWITDVAWHQVLKFTHDGKLLKTLGERAVAGEDQGHFNQPSDVAVAHDGAIYVSDGYGNNRIVKLDADGGFIKAWGTKGAAAGQLDLPHGLAVSRDGKVYVVDRSNGRIQVFDSQGATLAAWRDATLKSAQAVKVARDGHVYVACAGEPGVNDLTGVVIFDTVGNVIGKVGRYGNYDGQFYDLHWLAVSDSGVLYTADFAGRRVLKFTR
jgi:peptidylamidoglycolate lyase